MADDGAKLWKDRAEQSETEVTSLRLQLQAIETDGAQGPLHQKLDLLEKYSSQLEEDLSNSRNEKIEAERHAQDLLCKMSNLEERAKQLEDEKVALEARISELTKSDEGPQLEEELAVERGRHHEAREEVQTLTRSLEEARAEFSDFRNQSEAVVCQWTGKH